MRSPFRLPVWVIPLAVAALVAALGWWGNQRLRQTVGEDLRADLTSTLHANVMALEIWAANQIKLASALAGEPTFRVLAIQTLESHQSAQTNGMTAIEPAEELSRYLRGRLEGLGYEIAHIVNPQLRVVSTSISSPRGVDLTVSEAHIAKYTELFTSGQGVIITPFKAGRPANAAVGTETNRAPESSVADTHAPPG
jgi:hypothetical protein